MGNSREIADYIYETIKQFNEKEGNMPTMIEVFGSKDEALDFIEYKLQANRIRLVTELVQSIVKQTK